MKIGFVGLGIMGRPMAHNLMKGGHELFVYGKRTVPPEIREGGTVLDSLKAVAEHAETIIIMVPDTPDVQDVLFSPDGVASGLKPGKTVIDMSSISPIETKEFAARIVQKGCDYVDAPVSGGEVGAKAASLTIMVGGSERAFNRVKPLFELMGKNITLVGGNGDGQTCKVANQIIVALNIAAVGEALLYASKAGADPAKVRQALMGGFATKPSTWLSLTARTSTTSLVPNATVASRYAFRRSYGGSDCASFFMGSLVPGAKKSSVAFMASPASCS